MNGRELKEILSKMEMLSKKTKGRMRIDASHVLIRGLRRGVGIYNEELPGPYLQVVQKFAQKGRLGAVFSDESLAYGVNMPFRTSAFVGDPGPEILDALVAQQAPALLDRLRWQQHLNKHVVNKRRTIMSTTCSNGIGKSCLFHQV